MLLGWNPGTEKEIYSLEEFISAFSLERVHKTDLISFDREKLLWFNGVYIRQMSVEDLWLQIVKWAARYGVDLGIDDRDHDYITKVVAITQERLRLFSEFNELTSYFFTEPKVDKELLNKQAGSADQVSEILDGFKEVLSKIDNWNHESIDKACHEFIEQKGYKNKEAFMTLRVAVTGSTMTPPVANVLEVLGSEKVLNRISQAR
ncbi:MAG TPA: hypothetical protein VLI92_01345, partial [Candidatus Saccharimonadales bacterium]|nr:hypothetical protein [Candidatus Saccharimonadales bacterium]